VDHATVPTDRPDTPGDAAGRPRVVVGVDGPIGSRAALVTALGAAARRDATLEVVAAHPADVYLSEPRLTDPHWIDEVRAETETRARSLVEEVRADPEVTAVSGAEAVRVVAETGSPAEVLVRRSAGAGLMVVGSKSRSRLTGMVLGSVALHCVVHAPCPVMVVHPPRRERARSTAPAMVTAGP
jgi:nucleotide-binding universal stress UspA family protein